MAYSDELWQEAKRKCRLNAEDVALAKRLGLSPRSLIKNIPSKSQPWKAPIKDWLHKIDAKRQKKTAQKQQRKEKAQKHFPEVGFVNDKKRLSRLTNSIRFYVRVVLLSE